MKKLIDCLKVGDKVWHITKGWATVLEINNNNFIVDGGATVYQADGRYGRNDTNPSIFLHEVKLEQNLPKFVEGEIVIVFHGKWVIAKYHSSDTGNKHNVFLSSNPGCIFSEILTQVLTVKTFNKSHFQQN